MAWVTLFVMLGKLSGAGKEMALAWQYGIGPEVDGYLFVLSLVSWPLALWFSVLTIALVPLAARMRRENPAELPRFRAELLGAAILFGCILALAAVMLVPLLIQMQDGTLPPATAAYAQSAIPALVLLLPLGVLASLFSAWMLAAGLHANTLLEGVPALVIAVAILLGNGGIEPLAWGTAAGFLLHMVLLAAPLRHRGELERPRLGVSSPAWQSFRSCFAIMLVGNALMSLIDLIDLMFAVRLGAGAVSTLSYSNRVLALILGLGGTAISRATLPVFSNEQAAGKGNPADRIHAIATRWVWIMLATGAVTVLLLLALATPLIELLFQRGAFSAVHTAVVADVLRHGTLQLPFFFAGLVLVSSLVARGLHRAVATVAAVNLPVKAAANFLLVPHFGLNGIVLATGVMYAASFGLLCLYALHAHKNKVDVL